MPCGKRNRSDNPKRELGGNETERRIIMTATQVFYATVPESGMFTFPEELRGKPLKIVVEEESAKSPVRDLVDFCTKENERQFDSEAKKGILGLRGILKGLTDTDLEDARYEYLMEKYVHNN
jgi:hypothetical protein